MSWFIFSEVMFFAAFFGALFYIRVLSVPDLGGMASKLLWPNYAAQWPTNGPYDTSAVHADGRDGHPAHQHDHPLDVGRDAHHRPPRAEGRPPRRSSSCGCS